MSALNKHKSKHLGCFPYLLVWKSVHLLWTEMSIDDIEISLVIVRVFFFPSVSTPQQRAERHVSMTVHNCDTGNDMFMWLQLVFITRNCSYLLIITNKVFLDQN